MKYTEDMVKKITEQLSAGMSRNDTFRIVGVNPDTFYIWMKTKPDFSDRVLKAEFASKQRMIVRIQNHARKDWHAAAWWLERKHYEEFGRRDRFEVTGARGGPIRTAQGPDLSGVTEKDLVEFVVSVNRAAKLAEATPGE